MKMTTNMKSLRAVLAMNYHSIKRNGIPYGHASLFKDLLEDISERFPGTKYGRDLMNMPLEDDLPNDIANALGRYLESLNDYDPAFMDVVIAMSFDPEDIPEGFYDDRKPEDMPVLEDTEVRVYPDKNQATWDEVIDSISNIADL